MEPTYEIRIYESNIHKETLNGGILLSIAMKLAASESRKFRRVSQIVLQNKIIHTFVDGEES